MGTRNIPLQRINRVQTQATFRLENQVWGVNHKVLPGRFVEKITKMSEAANITNLLV